MRSFLDRCDRPIAGVLIGYPGADRIGAGARGFWRATLEIAGVMAHSGSSRDSGTNAVAKAAQLVVWLAEWQERLAREIADDFPLPPKATVTRIDGGGEFSVVPDRCEIGLDVRLTFSFAADAAEAQVRALLDRLDKQHSCPRRSRIVAQSSRPAYRLPADSPIAAALGRAGERILRRPLPFVVTGPSNDGNLLAERGIPATCGFGAAYRNIHAPDECVDVSSLAPAFRVYEAALEELLGTERTAE
jgi:succinyl-diaminopimelate desuccinylase